MKSKSIVIQILVCIICIVHIQSCVPKEEFPIEPQVTFLYAQTAITESDKLVQFTFELRDGDGDFGLSPNDTTAPFTDSLYFNFHGTILIPDAKGEYKELSYPLRYRIAQLRNKEDTRALQAIITIDIAFAKALFPHERIYISYFVVDRMLHRSNRDTSKLIEF